MDCQGCQLARFLKKSLTLLSKSNAETMDGRFHFEMRSHCSPLEIPDFLPRSYAQAMRNDVFGVGRYF